MLRDFFLMRGIPAFSPLIYTLVQNKCAPSVVIVIRDDNRKGTIMTRIRTAAAVLAATCFAAGLAMADGRAPTAEETTAVSAALTKAGFSKWGKIEFDDGKWEIDNAVGTDGKMYDVDLSATDFSVIKKEIDND
jgi:hypothetical protein